MARDLASVNVRRDLVEEKELQLRQSLSNTLREAYTGKESLCFQFNVMADSGNLVSALVAGAADLLNQLGLEPRLWCCLLMLFESTEGVKQWIVDPSFEESCNLSNNFLLVTQIGARCDMRVGADQNRTSFAPQNSPTLNFKPSAVSLSDLREGVKLGQSVCRKAVGQQKGDEYTVTL